MKASLRLAVLAVSLVWISQPGPADAAQPAGDLRPRNTAADLGSYVSVVTQPGGEPILVIRYPWKRHARPSVEIRALRENEVGNRLIQPLLFAHNIMKGKVTKAVYLCQDRSEGLPQTATFSEGDVDFEIFGARNALGKPSVCVACRTKPADSEPETSARAAFSLLDAWAVDERTLYLELPPAYFSNPTKIRVWLLRGKDIVWTEDADWPGPAE